MPSHLSCIPGGGLLSPLLVCHPMGELPPPLQGTWPYLPGLTLWPLVPADKDTAAEHRNVRPGVQGLDFSLVIAAPYGKIDSPWVGLLICNLALVMVASFS